LILLVLRPVSIGVLQQPPLGAGEMFQGLFPGLFVLKLTHLKPFVSAMDTAAPLIIKITGYEVIDIFVGITKSKMERHSRKSKSTSSSRVVERY